MVKEAADGELKGILGYEEKPLVSLIIKPILAVALSMRSQQWLLTIPN